MLAHGWGRILNVSSFAGSGPSRPNGSAYASSKAALDRLTLSLCAEVRDTGVTCNAIYPGDTDTQMQTQIRNSSAEVLGEQELAYFRNRYSRGELYDPLVPATLIMALLVSELNGEIINLDDDRGMNLVRNYTP
jgi:NAD(P)-dependent dehydrogenase (short-subunit alcohol dehydrogenase family)